MSQTLDLRKNPRIVQEWEPWSTTEELENDPFLNLDPDKENDPCDVAFFREISKMPNLLDNSADTSTYTSVDQLSPLFTTKSTGTKKVYQEQKEGLSIPLSTASAVTVELEQPETPRLTKEDKSNTHSLRRSRRSSTQKKTRETEERLKLRSSSLATPKTSNDIAQFLSPEFESMMAQSALSNALLGSRLFETKFPFSLISLPLIPTPPDIVTSQSLAHYQIVPGLDEWNHLYLSRPQKGSQFAIWEWLDTVRLTAFRYPLSVVKYETSLLDIWTQASTSISSSSRDMSVSPEDIFVDEVNDDIMASLIGDIFKEDESSCFSAEKKPGLDVGISEFMSPVEKSICKKSDAISSIEFHDAGELGAADLRGKENVSYASNAAILDVPTECSASQKIRLDEKVVSFEEVPSPPKLKNEANIAYRKTPHFKVSKPSPNKTLSLNPHAPGYHPNTPFDKAHYPTTPYGYDSPSTVIPDGWVQLFLDRPDPFESSTKQVLSWLGEVSDLIENVNVKVSTIAVGSMPSVSSMNDTPMTRKLNVMSPVFPSMMSTSFASPLYEGSNNY